jgi:hypothetical protein
MTKENKGDEIIIAEYMGAKIIERDEGRIVCDFPKRSGLDWWLDYDTKWDWLMPVLEKIQQDGCIVGIGITTYGTTVNISPLNTNLSFNNTSDKPIEAGFKSAVQYIKWKKEQ